ncbi:methyltransferase [Flavobacteriaceae bacterium LYZ1037]|nr:methyltransferase [Flavobacteriaceae bacterium LYZ1037]
MRSYRLYKFNQSLNKYIKKLKNKVIIYRGKDLRAIGKIYGTDKVKGHNYTDHYIYHFKKYRKKEINLLEIGVGGFEKTNEGGNSLKMWKSYFCKGNIFSFDIYDKTSLQEDRIKIFIGSQVDKEFLHKIMSEIGNVDLIIDDGSHINSHVITTFKILFPLLKIGGIYVIEDTQTSYWKEYGGDSVNLNNPKTTMNFFKGLVDSLNNKEFLIDNYEQNYYDKHIISMHFYHNLIFIYKGINNEESNMVVNNKR